MKMFPVFLMLVCCWNIAERPVNDRVVVLAEQYVGHTEVANNRSPLIDHWNTRLGVPVGSNYCASFVSFILDSVRAEVPVVRSAVAQHFITRESITAAQVLRGDTVPGGSLVIWKRGNSWMGHTEIVKEWSGCSGKTIGANTSPQGSTGSTRVGNGVWERERTIVPTAYLRITHFTKVQ